MVSLRIFGVFPVVAQMATQVPPNGRICAHTGLKHAKLYSLLAKGGIGRPYIRVANLREPCAKQAKTILHLGGMLRFLDNLAAGQGLGLLRRWPEAAPCESREQSESNKKHARKRMQ
jgi:hypothetical protein